MRRLFFVASVLAIVHLAALLGLVGFGWTQGWLERERLLGAYAALTESMEAEPESTEVGEAEEGEVSEPLLLTSDQIKRNQDAAEQMRIELERAKREIQDGRSLLETQMLAFVREREAFETQKQRFAAEREAQARKVGDSGMQKELDTLAGIDAKSAKELLKLKDEAEVARILLAMDGRKRNKIVKQCKTEEERLWIGRVLEKFHANSAARAEDLGAD